MKTTRRSAISQSMDLFIIIAVVLACGGVVAAAAMGLIGTSTSQPSVSTPQLTLGAGSAASAFSITVKDSGSTSFSSVTMTVTFSGVPALTGTPAALTVTSAGSDTWTNTAPAAGNTFYAFTATSASLSPGQTTGFSTSIPQSQTAITAGNTYPVTITIGSYSYSTSVLATQA